ncbi:MAG TPA: PAS domain-containing protein, partial [Roseiflexaceae bacterium]
MMKLIERWPLHAVGFVALLALAAAGLSLMARPLLEASPFLPFLPVVWLSAWYHGRTGGVTATAASLVAVAVIVFPASFLFGSANLSGARLLSFTVVALAVTWVTAAWRDGRALLESTLSSIGEAVLSTDIRGRVAFLNPVAETLTGWSRSEARGKAAAEVFRLLHEQTRAPMESPVARVLRECVAWTSV